MKNENLYRNQLYSISKCRLVYTTEYKTCTLDVHYTYVTLFISQPFHTRWHCVLGSNKQCIKVEEKRMRSIVNDPVSTLRFVFRNPSHLSSVAVAIGQK